ncbi:serine hydrolase domain-containing protein [Photobacterium profundum]|uniref:Beta-lactamase-related domain-containing protein n=1 Tax=Photobacterium profundum (strain SS9) TaxID=298386 RepID=Q6LFW9_PHOPR|nr:serine hydrolase [Photobacterium profundum]CAG23811.1 hypothetical protein PBPRB1966 [Photobacterium profundum SS9]
MKKQALAALIALSVSIPAMAATFNSPDKVFIKASAAHAITVENWDSGENAASTFTNAYKFTNSYRISHGLLGAKADVVMPEALQRNMSVDLSTIMIDDLDGKMPLTTFLRDRLKNHSMVVLKNNHLVHQHFWNNMDENSTHLDMSVTKSYTSMLAAIAVSEGKLDMSKPVTDYLPELNNTGWSKATVQEVADMRTSLKMTPTKGKSWDDRMTGAQGYNGDLSKTYPNGVADYFKFVTSVTEPMGSKYMYQCANTEVLGKIVEAATGERLADLLESEIWQKVGMENDAFLMSDPSGYPMASGGLNATTRDLARTGRMILNNGKNYLGEQVVPKQFIDNLFAGNDTVRSAWSKGKESALADGWYKDQFRLLNVGGHNILAMVGIHGQVVAMHKETGIVIAMNGGYPMTETPRMAISLFHKVIPAIIDAINEYKSK